MLVDVDLLEDGLVVEEEVLVMLVVFVDGVELLLEVEELLWTVEVELLEDEEVLLFDTVEEVEVLEAVVVDVVGLIVDEDEVDEMVGLVLEEEERLLLIEELLLEEVEVLLLLLEDEEVLDALDVELRLGELCDEEELTLLLLLTVPDDVEVVQLLEALDALVEEGANAATASSHTRTASTSVTPLIGALVAHPAQPTRYSDWATLRGLSLAERL